MLRGIFTFGLIPFQTLTFLSVLFSYPNKLIPEGTRFVWAESTMIKASLSSREGKDNSG